MGVQAGAQVENLCQAHILLGRPVRGEGQAENRLTGLHQAPATTLHAIQHKIQGRGGELTVATESCQGGWREGRKGQAELSEGFFFFGHTAQLVGY